MAQKGLLLELLPPGLRPQLIPGVQQQQTKQHIEELRYRAPKGLTSFSMLSPVTAMEVGIIFLLLKESTIPTFQVSHCAKTTH